MAQHFDDCRRSSIVFEVVGKSNPLNNIPVQARRTDMAPPQSDQFNDAFLFDNWKNMRLLCPEYRFGIEARGFGRLFGNANLLFASIPQFISGTFEGESKISDEASGNRGYQRAVMVGKFGKLPNCIEEYVVTG